MDDAIDLKHRVAQIIRSVFSQPDLVVSDNTVAADVPNWDSFNHMNLIMQLEEEFRIAFETEEIGKMGRVGDLIEAVRRKRDALR